MEVLVRYGSEAQKREWLEPLLRGESVGLRHDRARRGFVRRHQYGARAVREGDEWVINGRKWWTSGACDPR